MTASEVPDDDAPAILSPREWEVAQLVSQGYTNKAIAAAMGISQFTVSSYARRMFAKLAVGTRAEMVAKLTEQPTWLAKEVTDLTRHLRETLAAEGVEATYEQTGRALAAAGIKPGAIR